MHHVFARCEIEVESVGCGVVGHDEACLCDVVVTEVAPIRYGLHELPLVMEVSRRLSRGWPWTGGDIVDVMSVVLHVYDQVHDGSVSEPSQPCPDRAGLVAFHAGGGCILDALSEFAIDFNSWKWVMFGPKSSLSSISMEGWVYIESKYMGGSATAKAVAEEYGVSRPALSKAAQEMGWQTAHALPALTAEQHRVVVGWLADGESATTVASKIWTEFGVEMTRAAISMMRTRLTRRGII